MTSSHRQHMDFETKQNLAMSTTRRALLRFPESTEPSVRIAQIFMFVRTELHHLRLSLSMEELQQIVENAGRGDGVLDQHLTYESNIREYLARGSETVQLRGALPAGSRPTTLTLCTSRKNCAVCECSLPLPCAMGKPAVVYNAHYTTTATMCQSKCTECSTVHGYGWWKREGAEFTCTEKDALSQRYLMVTSESLLSLSLLRDLDAIMVSAATSYEQFLNSRNTRCGPLYQPRVHSVMAEEVPGRWELNLPRLINAHTLYAFLLELERGDLLDSTPLPRFTKNGVSADQRLLKLIETHLPRIQSQFTLDFMGHGTDKDTRCGEDCSVSCGWDGNNKMKYAICRGTDGPGLTELWCEELGTVLRVCNRRPVRGSKGYCALHMKEARVAARARSARRCEPCCAESLERLSLRSRSRSTLAPALAGEESASDSDGEDSVDLTDEIEGAYRVTHVRERRTVRESRKPATAIDGYEYLVDWAGTDDAGEPWQPSWIRPELDLGSSIVATFEKHFGGTGAGALPAPRELEDFPAVQSPLVFEYSAEEEREMQAQWGSEKCGTLKRDQYKNAYATTAGVMAAVYNCGICCKINMMYTHESLSQGYVFLKQMYLIHKRFPTATCFPALWYHDDACHADKFIKRRAALEGATEEIKHIATLTFAVDRFHMRGHCKACQDSEYNADRNPAWKGINMSACEQQVKPSRPERRACR